MPIEKAIGNRLAGVHPQHHRVCLPKDVRRCPCVTLSDDADDGKKKKQTEDRKKKQYIKSLDRAHRLINLASWACGGGRLAQTQSLPNLVLISTSSWTLFESRSM